jgi:hypothetical protein
MHRRARIATRRPKSLSFPLVQASAAHAAIENRGTTDKVVLRVAAL